MSVRGQVCSPRISGGQRWLSCRQPACPWPRQLRRGTDRCTDRTIVGHNNSVTVTLTAVGHFQLLARWPGTHSQILSLIQRAAQTVLGVYLKRTSSRVTSASSALGVFNYYALYKSTHSLTRIHNWSSDQLCAVKKV